MSARSRRKGGGRKTTTGASKRRGARTPKVLLLVPKRGGARPGAGRPAAGEIPWAQVERYAAAGGLEPEISVAFGITEAQLQDRTTAERYRQALAKGHARYKLELREQIKERGMRTAKGSGSVHSLALQARNHLEWDRETQQHLLPPDLSAARDRLRDTLVRLAAARSDVEGRTVTPAELVFREAFGAGVENAPVGGGGV